MRVENAGLLNSIVGHGTAIPTYSNANRSTSMSIYRRLYEQAHGPIPKDEQGRSYEIHHIDGNRKNNELSNLIALSIEDHYKVHLEQGDYGAAKRIIARINVSPELLSELARKENQRRIDNGTHNWLGGGQQKKQALEQIANGTHQWLGKTNPVHKQKKDGTLKLFDREWARERELKKVKNGTHPFVGDNNPVYKYIADGTSHLLGERNPVHKLLKEGKHNTQIQVTCPYCNKTGSQPAMIRWHFDNCKRKTNE